MKVSAIMTPNVQLVSPDQPIQEAANLMEELDAGSLPVSDGERLVGYITDRDIALRAVARGLGPETKVKAVMSQGVKYCFEDDDVASVAKNMAENQIRRLPVLSRAKRLVGIVALGDIATEADRDEASTALAGISETSGMHNQTVA